MAMFRLPDGNWIDPSIVRSILFFPSREYVQGAWTARNLQIGLDGGKCIVVRCDSDEEAVACRDALAEVVNGLCGPVPTLDPSIPQGESHADV